MYKNFLINFRARQDREKLKKIERDTQNMREIRRLKVGLNRI